MQRLLTTTVLAAALVAAACGGKGSAPTAPSNEGTNAAAPSGPATPGSATITGRVQSAGSGATVAVAGTQASTGLDAAGNFTLRNVTPGDVQLRVSSAGANAMVALAGVQAAQTVEIVVSMAGASANLESEVRHGAGEAELKGTVEALPPTTAALTFKAAGKTVVTNASTVFVDGSATRSFADLKVGNRIEAKGSFAGDTLTASRVEIEDHAGVPNPGPTPAPTPKPEPEAELRGDISALTGTAASFQFTIGSRLVKGDATTTFDGSSNSMKTFADLKNGVNVEVKGVQKDGFVQASRIHLENEAAPGPGAEAELEGTVSGLTGSASSFQFTIGSVKVNGDGTTTFDGSGSGSGSGSSTKSFADLKNGVKVEVKGVRATDGSVRATRIHIENDEDDNDNDENENEAEVEGTLGAITGTCPAITSTVGSTKFTTSASTRFDDAACSAFKAGDRVEVKGTKNADGSIAATRLKKK